MNIKPYLILQEGAKTYEQRSKLYGDTFLQVGAVMQGLFPGQGAAHHNRLQLVLQIANKLTRYATLLPRGGHKDSAHDIMVYAAMLESITEEQA